jgi:hypothetical protein
MLIHELLDCDIIDESNNIGEIVSVSQSFKEPLLISILWNDGSYTTRTIQELTVIQRITVQMGEKKVAQLLF